MRKNAHCSIGLRGSVAFFESIYAAGDAFRCKPCQTADCGRAGRLALLRRNLFKVSAANRQGPRRDQAGSDPWSTQRGRAVDE